MENMMTVEKMNINICHFTVTTTEKKNTETK